MISSLIASLAPKSLPEAANVACKPSKIDSEANLQYNAIALVASSLPGIGKSTPSGLLLESIIAITGILRTLASVIAICS